MLTSWRWWVPDSCSHSLRLWEGHMIDLKHNIWSWWLQIFSNVASYWRTVPRLTWHANHIMHHKLSYKKQLAVTSISFLFFKCSLYGKFVSHKLVWPVNDFFDTLYGHPMISMFFLNNFSRNIFQFLIYIVSSNSKILRTSITANGIDRQQLSELNCPLFC